MSRSVFAVRSLAVSDQDWLASSCRSPDLADRLAIPVTRHGLKPGQLQWQIFGHMPGWVDALMRLRNRLVAVFGFASGDVRPARHCGDDPKCLQAGEQAGFLTVLVSTDEVCISHAEDRHMSFWLAVSKEAGQAVVATRVQSKTRLGRLYLELIRPFHWLIARAVISSAAKAGRI
ncbi:DUF2867 domain-containing protein [Oceanobacter mangrovi]|uniref:DUF2867 domain-containing protein n=1 Tax=Oceanobacter mangrovi TaxID=2862510 RepID=UPI001C8DB77E|nr:DUF2867 domain-containing protein [Oceanobacter mangrovi]